MENFKIWAPLVLLSVLVGGIFLYRHLELVDAANVGYMTARESLRIAEDSLKAQTTRWESISTAVGEATSKLKVATEKAEQAAATLAEAENVEKKHLEDLDYMTGAFLGLVEKVRAKAIGTTLPTVVLQDGKQLTNAQIKRVEDKGVSFFHSEGSGFVEADNLPADLQSKLDLGSGSIERKAASLKSSLMDAGKDGTSMPPSIASSSATTSATPAKPSVTEEKLKKLRLQLVEVNAKMAAAARNRNLWLLTADKYADQASDAAFRGVPTSKHRADEAAARNQAALHNQQIGVLEAEAARLRVEEESLLRQ